MCLSRNQPTKVKTFNYYKPKKGKVLVNIWYFVCYYLGSVMLWLYGVFKGAFSPRYCFLGQQGNVHFLSGRGGGGGLVGFEGIHEKNIWL